MKKLFTAIISCLLLAACLTGCAERLDRPSAKHPVKLTIWHTYVEQMGDEFGVLVEEFNTTVGAREGVVIDFGSVSNASELNARLLDAASGVPGAPPLPDMAVVYPKIALQLVDEGMLVDIKTYFNETNLAGFVPHFLEEGYLGGDTLYLLPVAKSTEILYVNKTFFDSFAAETGVTWDQLSSVEGLIAASEAYYEWTDAQTPDIPQDGKAFYYPDNPFNFAEIGFAQIGETFFDDGALNLASPAFERIWNSYYPQAVRGGVAIFNNYGNYLAMTGSIVCVTSTSAGTMFYPSTVTYADNTKEDVEFDILPYPTFEGGEKVAMQRGGGICILKSEPKREYAAALFLKWLTAPEQNLRFTANAGYLPVEKDAFSEIVSNPDIASDPQIRKMLTTAAGMQSEYSFFIPSVLSSYNEISTSYSEQIYATAKRDRARYLELIAAGSTPEAAYAEVSTGAFERFCAELAGGGGE